MPGKSTRQQQLRAWHYLAALGADVILLQEVEWAAIPAFAHHIWTSIKGDEILELADAPWDLWLMRAQTFRSNRGKARLKILAFGSSTDMS